MAARFYVNCPLSVGPVVLTGPESHHLATVLRARPGAAVCLFNGDGAEYQAEIIEVHKKQVVMEITGRRTPQRELDFRLEIAAPLPKADRGDFLLEKLTEMGVTRFVPLRTQRSIVNPREARLEKLERAVIEASKQCGRNVLMEIGPVTEWGAYCRDAELPPARLVAHPGGLPLSAECPAGDVAIAVGPEGGFTDDEIGMARSEGWRAVDLGPRILRVETAALALAVKCSAATACYIPNSFSSSACNSSRNSAAD
jgi:16S rRNA (uracil1498-N3)-methyltransferase